MPGGRFLIMLIVIAAGLLTVALAVSSGHGDTRAMQASGEVAGPATAGINWPNAANALVSAAAPNSRGELLSLLVGFLGGWVLRWVYALPWGAMPRAMLDWLLSWRWRAFLASLAVCCTVILLFY